MPETNGRAVEVIQTMYRRLFYFAAEMDAGAVLP